MPIKQLSKKAWEVDGITYDSETEAEKAYQAVLALKLGVKPKKKKKKQADEEE